MSAAAAGAALLMAGLTGCGAVRDAIDNASDSSGSSSQPSSTYSAPPTYDPDATGEVVGTNCRYDDTSHQIKYDLSISNASPDQAFKYSVRVSFKGGDGPFSDDSFGSDYEQVTVGGGRDRKLLITQGITFTKHTYYGCHIESATKSLAG
jgi:hypothetical protein